MSSANSWWCNRCNKAIGQPRSAGRAVCPRCYDGFVEEVENGNHGAKELREAMAQSMQSMASFKSRRPFNPSFSCPKGLVHEDEFLPVAAWTMTRENTGNWLRGPGPEQLLQESVEGDPGRRGPPPASRGWVDSLVEVKVSGKDVAAQCAKCDGEFEIGEFVKRMSCNHMYHPDCIVEWLAQQNFCPACRCKISADDPEYDRMHSSGRNDTSSSGTMGISRARFDSHRSFSPYIWPSHAHVHDDEFLRRMMRSNMGECSLGPGLEQLLQESVESDPGRRGPPPASRALLDSLMDVEVRGKDVAVQCVKCNCEFEIGTYAKRTPCGHMYHTHCIREWLAQHNSCRACRYKISTDNPEYDRMHSRGRNETSFSGTRPRFSHIRPFRASMTPFQQAQAETSSGSASSGKTVSSFVHDTQGNNFGLDDDGDVIMQDPE